MLLSPQNECGPRCRQPPSTLRCSLPPPAQVAADKLGLNPTAMVMLQVVGGAAGQMISISNILGGRAVMGLQAVPEGQFERAALPAVAAYYVAGTRTSLPFLFMS